MIKTDGTAPYAPTPAVMAVIDAFRNRPVPTPITIEVAKRIGVKDSLAARTVQALRLLDLLDEAGNPTPAFQDIRKASEAEFRALLADVIRAAYAEIFAYRDPATDDSDQILEAFRAFQPMTLRKQMARLFLGLCEEAGIIDRKQAVSAKPSNGKPNKGRRVPPKRATHTTGGGTIVTAGFATAVERDQALPITPAGQAGADHMAIRGLLQTLPPVGSVFPDAKRRDWADAVLAAFALIYERENTNKGGDSD